METTSLPRTLAVGDRPRATGIAILAAVAVAAVDAATTAVLEPVTPTLVARAATAAAWYTTGVAVLLVGPLGYALGALSRPDSDHAGSLWSVRSLRSHLGVAPEQATPLVAWVAVALGATTAATAFSPALPVSPTAVAPVPAAAGLAVAVDLGRRARRALPSAVAGWVGATAGIHLFGQGFVLAGPTTLDVPSLAGLGLVVGLVVALGCLAGVPFGLVGYAIGRTLTD
jgi:hypothetical protein